MVLKKLLTDFFFFACSYSRFVTNAARSGRWYGSLKVSSPTAEHRARVPGLCQQVAHLPIKLWFNQVTSRCTPGLQVLEQTELRFTHGYRNFLSAYKARRTYCVISFAISKGNNGAVNHTLSNTNLSGRK